MRGEGVLGDIAYDEHERNASPPKQAPDSRELLVFSCGHEVEASRLAEAARDDPNVERRQTEDTIDRVDVEGGSTR